MFAKVKSQGLFGLEGFDVVVEADISSGLPRFDVVGLPDAAVKESRERVRASIKTSTLPSRCRALRLISRLPI